MAKLKAKKKKDEAIYIPHIPLNSFIPMPKKVHTQYVTKYAKEKKTNHEFIFEDIENFVELCNKLELTPGQMIGVILRLILQSLESST